MQTVGSSHCGISRLCPGSPDVPGLSNTCADVLSHSFEERKKESQAIRISVSLSFIYEILVLAQTSSRSFATWLNDVIFGVAVTFKFICLGVVVSLPSFSSCHDKLAETTELNMIVSVPCPTIKTRINLSSR